MKGMNILIFAIGAAAGAVASYAFAKRKFLGLAQEEINSVKEVYSKRAVARDKPDLSEYAEVIKNEGYSSGSAREHYEIDKKTNAAQQVATDRKRPYVISPDEFTEDDEYDKISLTLYADGLLADENDEAIDNVDEIVGEDNLNLFESFEYEEDNMFIRNDILKADYEVLLDEREFAEVLTKSPHKIG